MNIQSWIRIIVLIMFAGVTTNLVADSKGVVHLTFAKAAVDPTPADSEESSSDPWPTIAANQDRRPVLRVTTNNGDPVKKCLDPCIGGDGCEGWDSEENTGCRTAGDSGRKECWPLYNRYCAYKEGQDGLLVDCKTCSFY